MEIFCYSVSEEHLGPINDGVLPLVEMRALVVAARPVNALAGLHVGAAEVLFRMQVIILCCCCLRPIYLRYDAGIRFALILLKLLTS